MYKKYLQQIEEAGKIRNLTQSTINSYRNFVSSFLTYMNKNPEELTCQDKADRTVIPFSPRKIWICLHNTGFNAENLGEFYFPINSLDNICLSVH